MDGYFVILIASYIFGVVVMFILVRAATRASESIELLTNICRSQSKQLLLLEKIVNDKLGIEVNDELYFQTSSLNLAKKFSINDFYLPDGSLDQKAVVKLVALYKTHRNTLGDYGYDISDAAKMFDEHVDNLISSLSEEEKTKFLHIYNAEKVIDRS